MAPPHGPITISACINADLFASKPAMLHRNVSGSTRDVTASERAFTTDKHLRWLVHFDSLPDAALQQLGSYPVYQHVANTILDPMDPVSAAVKNALHPG